MKVPVGCSVDVEDGCLVEVGVVVAACASVLDEIAVGLSLFSHPTSSVHTLTRLIPNASTARTSKLKITSKKIPSGEIRIVHPDLRR